MLKTEQIKSIATFLKIDPSKLETAIKDEKEVEVELPKEGQFMTPTDIESRDKNIKSTGYNEGVTAGKEMLVKDLKQSQGLTFEGKDPEKFITEFKTKVLTEAKLQPNEALKEKETIIANLQKNVQTLTEEKQQLENTHKVQQLNSKIYREVPPTSVGFEPEEVINSMKLKGYDFEPDEAGGIIAKLNGQVLRDQTTQNPLTVKDVIGSYVKERKWEKSEAETPRGRGAGNSTPNLGGASTLSQAKKAWEEQGKSANSSEFTAYVQGLAKDNQDFDMNA